MKEGIYLNAVLYLAYGLPSGLDLVVELVLSISVLDGGHEQSLPEAEVHLAALVNEEVTVAHVPRTQMASIDGFAIIGAHYSRMLDNLQWRTEGNSQ